MRAIAKMFDALALVGSAIALFAVLQGMGPNGADWTATYGLFGLSCAIIPHVIATALHRLSGGD